MTIFWVILAAKSNKNHEKYSPYRKGVTTLHTSSLSQGLHVWLDMKTHFEGFKMAAIFKMGTNIYD